MLGDTGNDGFLNILQVSMTVSTIAMFLAPAPTCIRALRQGHTGEARSLPFVTGVLSNAVGLKFAFLLDQLSMKIISSSGLVLMSSYSLIHLFVSRRRHGVLREITFAVVFLVALQFFIGYLKDKNYSTEESAFGSVGAILGIAFSASPLASMKQVIREKNTASLPFALIFMNFLVATQWTIFGFKLDNPFVYLPNFAGVFLTILQLMLFLIYPSGQQPPKIPPKTDSMIL